LYWTIYIELPKTKLSKCPWCIYVRNKDNKLYNEQKCKLT